MKKIWKMLLAALLLLMLPASLLAAGTALPSYYGESYYAVLPEMHQRLNTVDRPKILVVGGSNVAFGLDGSLLEELLARKGFDYAVCPLGLYAAVGTSAMLDLSESALNQGDIVVLAIEPTNQTMSDYFGAMAFWKCAEKTPELVLEVGREKQAALFGSYIPYVQERYSILRSGNVPLVQGVYAKASFNERCDMIYDRPGNIMAVGWDTGAPVDLGAVEIQEEFAQQVNNYCEAAARVGASVVLSFSPVNSSALTEDSDETVASFFDRCNRTFACPVISDPNNYILESGWFYDSNFHLNSSGALLRTCLLAEDLLAFLGCYQELEYTVPEMPASAAQVTENTTGQEYFTFAATAGGTGFLISGLTEEGRAQEQLSVPSSFGGKPVIGLAADALDGADRLVELRLPSAIESLPAGLFRGCPKLTRLILEHTGSVCRITEETFAGADQLRIYVPRASYPMYRDGYGCETNLWSQYLDRIYTY